jgi:DNA-binding MarR family transcriptional regulator
MNRRKRVPFAEMARRADPSRPATRWFDAWRGVLYANAKVLRLADADLVARFGFPLSWLDVLAQLHDAPTNSLRIQELQAGSVFAPSGITRLVDRIEAAGLVRRERVVGDRRGVLVALTPEGRRRHDEAFRAHLPLIEREFGGRLTADQQRAVADALSPFWHDDKGGSSG